MQGWTAWEYRTRVLTTDTTDSRKSNKSKTAGPASTGLFLSHFHEPMHLQGMHQNNTAGRRRNPSEASPPSACIRRAAEGLRLGAQGLYNVCTPVSSSDAQPGDLVFFVGTYDTPGVSHVGIYVGDGVMLHCGDPIQYSSINTSYWQSHFYAFGRPAY